MRLVTYAHPGQTAHLGALIGDDQVLDLHAASIARRERERDGGFLIPDDILAFLATGDAGLELANRTIDWAQRIGFATAPLGRVHLHAPVPRPGKLLALAGNYQEHIREGGGTDVDKSTSVPNVFIKPGTTVIGPHDPVKLPAHISSEVDWELEIAIVIGKPAYRVDESGAAAAIAGYAICNDISSRSLIVSNRRRETTARDAYFDWLAGKWQNGFAPFGPWLATADEVPDAGALAMSLSVNGEIKQQGSTGQMIFDAAETVAWISQLCTLEPGDVIITGTPAGVGVASGTFLAAGDEITCEIEGLGQQRTAVVAAG
jgi:2-keto-4-pentenoate hydratase/2-oxohepta-3-ene-1,7-dioic acid hydratase in catechol pathway